MRRRCGSGGEGSDAGGVAASSAGGAGGAAGAARAAAAGSEAEVGARLSPRARAFIGSISPDLA